MEQTGEAAVQQTENLNIESFEAMPTPEEIHGQFPLTETAAQVVLDGRRTLERILDREDPRLFLVVGPCSIHDPEAGLDYARRLKSLAEEVADTLVLVMRVYFEKPRTTTGWKGFINDPRMDGSLQIQEGLRRARAFLLQVNEIGLPAATEALDPITPQYIGDLIAWTAIGARTSESQTHREMSSGLSTPVGFKNGTDGSVMTAVNGILSASGPHSFLGVNSNGMSAVVRTRGNRYGHLVLRGGGDRPNYDTVSLALAEESLAGAGLPNNIVIDCSHANSFKKAHLQPLVMKDCVNQILQGNRSIVGVMVESFLESGNQPIPENLSQLRYGCSVTDPCLDWPATQAMVRAARAALRPVVAAGPRK
jgi:3-deoxy-7-phosphoheptulonate synthase